MDDYAMFKQALRGFDKDEVLDYIHQKEDEHGRQVIAMERDIRKRDKVIAELKSRIVQKDEQVERMEQQIRTKYQKYIDNYNRIGDLIYESRIKGDNIIEEAHQEAERIIEEAEMDARKRVTGVQAEIDAKLKDGKAKYLKVQDEMNEIVELFNQMQRKFMRSYKEVHALIQSMPVSLNDIDLEELGGFSGFDDLDLLDDFGLDEDAAPPEAGADDSAAGKGQDDGLPGGESPAAEAGDGEPQQGAAPEDAAGDRAADAGIRKLPGRGAAGPQEISLEDLQIDEILLTDDDFGPDDPFLTDNSIAETLEEVILPDEDRTAEG